MNIDELVKGNIYSVTYDERTFEMKYIGFIYEVKLKCDIKEYSFTQFFLKKIPFFYNYLYGQLCVNIDDYLKEYQEIVVNSCELLDQTMLQQFMDNESSEDDKIDMEKFVLTFSKNYLFIQGKDALHIYYDDNLPKIEKREKISIEHIPEISLEQLKEYYEESKLTINSAFKKINKSLFRSIKDDILNDFVFRYANIIEENLDIRKSNIESMKEYIIEFYKLKEHLPELEDDIYLFRKNLNVNYRDIINETQLVEHYPIPFSVSDEAEYVLNWSDFSTCCHYIIKVPKFSKILIFETSKEEIEATLYPGYLIFDKIYKINYKGNELVVILCNYSEYTYEEVHDMLELYKRNIKLDSTKKFDRNDYEDTLGEDYNDDDNKSDDLWDDVLPGEPDYKIIGGKKIKKIIKNDLNNNFYKKKYFKYKQKYIKLKNNNLYTTKKQ